MARARRSSESPPQQPALPSGTRVPLPGGEPLAGQELHLAYGGEEAASRAEARAFLCADSRPGIRTVVGAPYGDPRFCAKCLRARPTSTGSGVRVVAVLVTPKQTV